MNLRPLKPNEKVIPLRSNDGFRPLREGERVIPLSEEVVASNRNPALLANYPPKVGGTYEPSLLDRGVTALNTVERGIQKGINAIPETPNFQPTYLEKGVNWATEKANELIGEPFEADVDESAPQSVKDAAKIAAFGGNVAQGVVRMTAGLPKFAFDVVTNPTGVAKQMIQAAPEGMLKISNALQAVNRAMIGQATTQDIQAMKEFSRYPIETIMEAFAPELMLVGAKHGIKNAVEIGRKGFEAIQNGGELSPIQKGLLDETVKELQAKRNPPQPEVQPTTQPDVTLGEEVKRSKIPTEPVQTRVKTAQPINQSSKPINAPQTITDVSMRGKAALDKLRAKNVQPQPIGGVINEGQRNQNAEGNAAEGQAQGQVLNPQPKGEATPPEAVGAENTTILPKLQIAKSELLYGKNIIGSDRKIRDRLLSDKFPDVAENGKGYFIVWADGRGQAGFKNKSDAIAFIEQGGRDAVDMSYRDLKKGERLNDKFKLDPDSPQAKAQVGVKPSPTPVIKESLTTPEPIKGKGGSLKLNENPIVKGKTALSKLKAKAKSEAGSLSWEDSETRNELVDVGKWIASEGKKTWNDFKTEWDKIAGDFSEHAENVWKTIEAEAGAAKSDERKQGTVGIKNAETRTELQRRGIDITDPVVQHHSEVFDRVIKSGADKEAGSLAQEVIANPRHLSVDEEAALTLRLADLQTRSVAKIEEINQLKKQGKDPSIAQSQLDAIEIEQENIWAASRLAGTPTARSLEFRKAMIKITDAGYELAPVIAKIKANAGDKFKPQMETEARVAVDQYKRAKDDLAKAEAKIVELQQAEINRKAQNVARAAELRAARQVGRQAREATLRAEIADLDKQIAESLRRVAANPIDTVYLVGKWAVKNIELGVFKAADAVDRIMEKYPTFTREEAQQAIASQAQDEIAKAEKHAQKLASAAKNAVKATENVVNNPTNETLNAAQRASYDVAKDDAQLAKIKEKIDKAREYLESGTRPEAGKPRPPRSEAVQKARQELRDLESIMRAKDRLADLEEQIRTGNYKERPEPREIPEELLTARMRARKARIKVDQLIRQSKPKTKWQTVLEYLGLPRQFIATGDMSAALRQAVMFAPTHPAIWAKSYGKAFQSYWSENKAAKIDYETRTRPGAIVAEKAGLYMADMDGVLGKREEFFMNGIAERIPIIGKIVRAADRNMTVMLNSIRADVFDDFVRRHPEATLEQLKAYADYVNIISGRGNLKALGLEQAAQNLGTVFFAPRFAVARIQTPYVIGKYLINKGIRKEIAGDMVKMLGTGLGILALAKYTGYKVGTDPRDPDFGKIVSGNSRIDIWGGNVQTFRFLYNLMMTAVPSKVKANLPIPSGWKGGASPGDLISRFVGYKLAPTLTVPYSLIRGKDMVNQPVTPLGVAANAVVPLFIQDAWDAADKEGLAAGIASGLASSQGLGISTYEKKQTNKVTKSGDTKLKIPKYGSNPKIPKYGSNPKIPKYGSNPKIPKYGSNPKIPKYGDTQ